MKIIINQKNVPSSALAIYDKFCYSAMQENISTIDKEVAILWFDDYVSIEKHKNIDIVLMKPGTLSNKSTWQIFVKGVGFIDGVDLNRFHKFPPLFEHWSVGEDILICFPPDATAQSHFTKKIFPKLVRTLTRSSTRRIAIRTKNYVGEYAMQFYLEDSKNFAECLDSYWAVISYDEYASVHAVINGLPTFADGSLASPMCRDIKHVADIENPYVPDRTEWYNTICHTEWFDNELASGDVWCYVKALFRF